MSGQTQVGEMIEVDGAAVRLSLRRNLYPLAAVYAAAYSFLDRCFVLLDAPDDERIVVELRGRELLDETHLRSLAGEFGNSLLNAAWREVIVEKNRPLVEAIAAQALGGALGERRSPLPDDFDASGDAFDDPLGIAIPWEEKYGKAAAEPPSEGAPLGPPVDEPE